MTHNEMMGYLKRIDDSDLCAWDKAQLQMYVALVNLVEDLRAQGRRIDRRWLDREMSKANARLDRSETAGRKDCNEK